MSAMIFEGIYKLR